MRNHKAVKDIDTNEFVCGCKKAAEIATEVSRYQISQDIINNWKVRGRIDCLNVGSHNLFVISQIKRVAMDYSIEKCAQSTRDNRDAEMLLALQEIPAQIARIYEEISKIEVAVSNMKKGMK